MRWRSILGIARPELELLAVTTVAGNSDLASTTENALRVLTLAGRTDIPVAAGAAGPLMRPLHIASDVHGEHGLGGADLPEPTVAPRPEGAIELLRATLERAERPVTIAAVGPLTNIALLLRTHPRIAERIASLRIMGGAVTEGNTTASAEFNIWQDPEAARIVFDAGRPIVMMPLDVTHQALVHRRGRGAAGGRRDPAGTRSSPTCCGSSRGSTGSATAGTARRSTTPWPWGTSPCRTSWRRPPTASTSRRSAS